MPFCPKCKNEYREGFKICPDCELELVDELTEENAYIEMAKVAETTQKELAERICSFLDYLKIENDISEQEEAYFVLADVSKAKEAVTQINIFLENEAERFAKQQFANNLSDDEIENYVDDDHSESMTRSRNFVTEKEKFESNLSSGRMLLVAGILGLVFTVLNSIGILSLFPVLFQQIVLYGLFLGCFVAGISCLKNAEKHRKLIKSEDETVLAVLKRLEEIAVLEELNKLPEIVDGENETNYLIMFNYLIKTLKNEYPLADNDMLEEKVDARLNEILS